MIWRNRTKEKIGEKKKRGNEEKSKEGNIGKGRLVPTSSLHVWWGLSPRPPTQMAPLKMELVWRGITKMNQLIDLDHNFNL